MNNKGFTMIELLSVVSVLSLIMIIMVPSVNSFLEENKKSLCESKKSTIETEAERYTNERINDYKCSFTPSQPCPASCGTCTIETITISQLITAGYLENECNSGSNCIENPKTDSAFPDEITITYDSNKIKTSAKLETLDPSNPDPCS